MMAVLETNHFLIVATLRFAHLLVIFHSHYLRIYCLLQYANKDWKVQLFIQVYFNILKFKNQQLKSTFSKVSRHSANEQKIKLSYNFLAITLHNLF